MIVGAMIQGRARLQSCGQIRTFVRASAPGVGCSGWRLIVVGNSGPQRLKPRPLWHCGGTTEVVPFPVVHFPELLLSASLTLKLKRRTDPPLAAATLADRAWARTHGPRSPESWWRRCRASPRPTALPGSHRVHGGRERPRCGSGQSTEYSPEWCAPGRSEER